jgi:lysophospholipase L1-like esterase
MRRVACLCLIELLLLTALAAQSRAGVPVLYHSPLDDGVPPTSVPVEPGSPFVTLFLYLDAGGVASGVGTPCVDGDGDELCAWELRLEVSGAASIQAFAPDGLQDIVVRRSSEELVATGGNALDGELGPIRLGELDLHITGESWSLDVTDGRAVDATFGLVNLEAGRIAIPEPSLPLALAVGVLTLAALRRTPNTRYTRARLRGVALLSLGLLALPSGAWAQDADADGIPDASDNCIHTPNAGQEDVGGLLGPPPDGVGDACQCGDLNDDGLVDLLDAALYQRALAGALPVALDEEKCSVVGGRLDCEPNDRQALREGLVGISSSLDQVCQAAQALPPTPAGIAGAGDSITQGFSADCDCNTGLICLFCPAGGDQPEYSWFDGDSLQTSFHGFYGGAGSGISSDRVSVSGAQMSGGADSFSSQADAILALVPQPDLVVVELGGNDICNRGCVDPANCGDPLYDDATWTAAVEAGLDKLVGFGNPTSLPAGSTIYLLGVPRIQDLHEAGVLKQTGTNEIDCESFWASFDVCEIATLDVTMNGEDLDTRRAVIATRVQRYNEILRDLALDYSTNRNGKNPNGIEVVSDYVNETLTSTGTTPFGPNEINGGDCFHPSVSGQELISSGAWYSNPR